MNKKEMFQVMTSLRLSFPNSYGKYNEEDFKLLCQNWFRFFEHDDYNIVMKAVDSFIVNDTTGFAPTIGQVKNKMLSVNPIQQIDTGKAWETVLRNARCDLRYAKENYDKLPKNIQKALGSYTVLSEIGYMDNESVQFARKEFERKLNEVLTDEKQMLLTGAITHEQIASNNSLQRIETRSDSVLMIGSTNTSRASESDSEGFNASELLRELEEELKKRNNT